MMATSSPGSIVRLTSWRIGWPLRVTPTSRTSMRTPPPTPRGAVECRGCVERSGGGHGAQCPPAAFPGPSRRPAAASRRGKATGRRSGRRVGGEVPAAVGVARLTGPLEPRDRVGELRRAVASSPSASGDVTGGFGVPALPGRRLPELRRAFGDVEVMTGVGDVAAARAGDGRRHGQHHRAELAPVVDAERRLGPVDLGPGHGGVGRGRDEGPVDAVQEVVSEDRPAGQRQRLVEEGPSLARCRRGRGGPRPAVAASAPRRADESSSWCSAAASRSSRSASVEVAREQRRLADRAPWRTPRLGARRCVRPSCAWLGPGRSPRRTASARRACTRPRRGGRRTRCWRSPGCRGCGAARCACGRTIRRGGGRGDLGATPGRGPASCARRRGSAVAPPR